MYPALALALLISACGNSGSMIAGEGTPTATSTPDPTQTPTPEPPAPEPSPELDALEAARQRWAEAAINEYAYTVTQSCECDDETSGPRRVRVVDGSVVATTYFGTPSRTPGYNAEELFAMIEDAVADGVEIDVRYDDVTGFPIVVLLDIEALAVDGGLSIMTQAFVSSDSLRAELAEARSLWEAAAIADYDLTFREVCFCPEIIVQVSIRNGEVAEVEITTVDPFITARTVPDLFATIEQAIDSGAFSVTATYDEETGYPLDFFVDVEEMMADEEFGVTVTSLDPV